jgi:hypothetical protein
MLRSTCVAPALVGVLLTAGVALADPTKENAVKTLNGFLAAIEASDFKKAATFLQPPPDDPPERLGRDLQALLARGEISKKGIAIIAAKGKWGKLDEVVSAAQAKAWAERGKVPVASCYGLTLDDAEAAFHWDGKRFTIIHVDDIGKLK